MLRYCCCRCLFQLITNCISLCSTACFMSACLLHKHQLLKNKFILHNEIKLGTFDVWTFSEAYIRRKLVLNSSGSRRVWKAVVCMAELIAALVLIHGLLNFLTDVNGFLDPPGGTVWLSVNHCCLRPVDHIVLVLFW